MKIIGLNHGEINSSAALAIDGRVVAGAPEERFNRVKRTRDFPAQALRYCLDFAGIDMTDCDAVAQAWNPAAHWVKYNPTISKVRNRREDYFYSVPDNLLRFAPRKEMDWVEQSFAGGALPPVYYVTHHRCHAANAFFMSPFDEAAILTSDFRGEFESTTMGKGRGNELDIFSRQIMPNSLGMIYATFTELLGYEPDGDEWKVMALSAFDVDCAKTLNKLKQTVNLGPNGTLEVDQSYYKGAIIDQPRLYTDKLVELLGGRVGKPGEIANEWHHEIARSMQLLAEEIAFHFLKYLWEKTRVPNLALSGGFFMNCVVNGKIPEMTPFKNVYISYAPADVGNSIGAALYTHHQIKKLPRVQGFNSSSIGPSFTHKDVVATLTRRGIPYKHCNNPAETVADLLAEGEVVSVLQGRMEFGERALGNRSILADPRNNQMKDKVNASIKYREGYRPFAPATLWERAHEFFDVPEGYFCPYMEKVVPVRSQHHKNLPAIVHIDGSARLQTVRQEDNPFFHSVILHFGKKTGFPVVMNTSFNVNGEPVVCSPDDAVSTFFNSGLRYLMIEDCLISK